MSLKNNPILKSPKIKVGITIGDPSGIGPSITLKAMQRLKGLADFVLIGDKWVLSKAMSSELIAHSFKIIDLNNVNHSSFTFGKVKAEYGRASIEYLDCALDLIKNKQIDCLVTCPISKEAINLAGYHYSGHTEYLAHNTGTKDFAMMLLNKELKFSLVSRHIPLKKVASIINARDFSMTVALTYKSLQEMFSVRKPRIVICGLNPHASDNGLIGGEENRIIRPVIKRLKKNLKADIDGPISADIAIQKAKNHHYDAVVAMYHDQALIPLKLTGNDTGVNITLGLPFVRTSPLHGTAFDIARKPVLAGPDSLIEAIRVAIKCTTNLKKD